MAAGVALTTHEEITYSYMAAQQGKRFSERRFYLAFCAFLYTAVAEKSGYVRTDLRFVMVFH